MMLRHTIPLAACLWFAAVSPAQADAASSKKSDLKVLLVSHDPKAPKLPFKDLAKERTHELYRERAAAFEKLLGRHFEHVELVYGDAYELAMSDAADVTIFDCRPKVLTPEVRETDPKTGKLNYQRAGYLPESFDRPALMISENSPLIGEPIGLKLDWL